MTPRQKLDTEYEMNVEKLQANCDHVLDAWKACNPEFESARDASATCSLCEARVYARRSLAMEGNGRVYLQVRREDTHQEVVRLMCADLDKSSSPWRAMFEASLRMKTLDNREAFAGWLNSTFGERPLSEWADLAVMSVYKPDEEATDGRFDGSCSDG